MGVRRNPEDDTYGDPKLAGDAMERPHTRPLRYTPGLKCDSHLESLRPERANQHRAIQVKRSHFLHGIHDKIVPRRSWQSSLIDLKVMKAFKKGYKK